jgi:hypothetical protein
VRSTILSRLTTDATLAALLPGGIYSATEISRQYTPGAFDASGEVRPCALLKMESEAPSGPYDAGDTLASTRLFVVVYVYERVGATAIDAALDRIFALLNLWHPTGAHCWEVRSAGDVRDLQDGALGCAMGYGRYVATRLR